MSKVKYTGVSSTTERDVNPFRISNGNSLPTRVVKIPLRFSMLRAKTKYKIFLQNDDGSRFEDISQFCTPYGKSIADNNENKIFDEFVSNENGELFLMVKPYGTDNVSLDNTDWDKHWRYVNLKTKSADVGRKNFVIVESSRVEGVDNRQLKTKIASGKISPISLSSETDAKTRARKTNQQIRFNYIQTFFIDPNKVDGSQTVDLIDLTLYFRNKPFRDRNNSNRKNPGATVALIDIENGQPVPARQYEDSITYVPWSYITPSTDATAQTIFEFKSPVRLETGRFYGIAVSFEDDDYILWTSKTGHLLVNSSELSPGSSPEHRGNLYTRTNVDTIVNNNNFDKVFTEKVDRDLKFDIHVAEYDLQKAANSDIDLVNINQEFLRITNTTNKWHGSEFVYRSATAQTGTVSVSAGDTVLTGVGTSFITQLRANSSVVLVQGNSRQVVSISNVISDTEARLLAPAILSMTGASLIKSPVAQVDHYDINSRLLFLKKSTAIATDNLYFDVNDTIIGVDSGETATIQEVAAFPISAFSTNFDLALPNEYSVTGTYQLSEKSGNTVTIISEENAGDVNFFQPNYVRDYRAVIASRSLEAKNDGALFDEDGNSTSPDGKSFRLHLDFEYTGGGNLSYRSPLIDLKHISLSTRQWSINNSTEGEHTNNGSALSKHISKRLVLSEGQVAEDVRVIQNAYRPIQTDVKVYAKILNNEDPEPFDDKNWTELTRIAGDNLFSEKDNYQDYREFEYSFPTTIPSDTTLDGTVSTNSGSDVITGTDTAFEVDLTEGDVIKLYSPFFENNYGYFSVVSITSNTEIVVNEPITNNDIIGEGFKIDTVTTPKTAFLNPLNSNIVRYFGSSGESYDGYSAIAIKTILLSEDGGLTVPRVDDNRVISVSA